VIQVEFMHTTIQAAQLNERSASAALLGALNAHTSPPDNYAGV